MSIVRRFGEQKIPTFRAVKLDAHYALSGWMGRGIRTSSPEPRKMQDLCGSFCTACSRDPSVGAAVLQHASAHVMSYRRKLSQHRRRRSAFLWFFFSFFPHSPTQTRHESWIIFVFDVFYSVESNSFSLNTLEPCLWNWGIGVTYLQSLQPKIGLFIGKYMFLFTKWFYRGYLSI